MAAGTAGTAGIEGWAAGMGEELDRPWADLAGIEALAAVPVDLGPGS